MDNCSDDWQDRSADDLKSAARMLMDTANRLYNEATGHMATLYSSINGDTRNAIANQLNELEQKLRRNDWSLDNQIKFDLSPF